MIKTLIAFVIAIGLFGGAIYYVNQQNPDTGYKVSNGKISEKPYQGNSKKKGTIMQYVSSSPDECAVIRFVCEEGEEYFSNEEGCGCVEKGEGNDGFPVVTGGGTSEETCFLSYQRRYEANSLEMCNLVDYMCDFDNGEKSFRDETGCGCSIPTVGGEEICLETGERYYYGNSPAECKNLYGPVTACDEGQDHFSDETGCGCFTPEGRDTNEYDGDVGIKNPIDPLNINLVLGQATTLNRYDVATLPDGSTLAIAEMVNTPCTEVCVWSGQGVWFNWYPKATPTKPVRMSPFPDEFPYTFEQLDTDYETYVKIRLKAKSSGGVSGNGPKVSRVEQNTAWYIYQDHLVEADYRNHCASEYQGHYDSCMSSGCSTEVIDGEEVTMCADDCNMVCILPAEQERDQYGPEARVREVSEGIAWYYQDQYVTDVLMEDHCFENYQGTFDPCMSAQACTGNCSAVCLPGCAIPN